MATLIGKSDTRIQLAFPKSEYPNTILDMDFKIEESDPNCHHGHHHGTGEEESPSKNSMAELETELSEMHSLVHQHEATIEELKQAADDMKREIGAKDQ